jgi:hypothetical protein
MSPNATAWAPRPQNDRLLERKDQFAGPTLRRHSTSRPAGAHRHLPRPRGRPRDRPRTPASGTLPSSATRGRVTQVVIDDIANLAFLAEQLFGDKARLTRSSKSLSSTTSDAERTSSPTPASSSRPPRRLAAPKQPSSLRCRRPTPTSAPTLAQSRSCSRAIARSARQPASTTPARSPRSAHSWPCRLSHRKPSPTGRRRRSTWCSPLDGVQGLSPTSTVAIRWFETRTSSSLGDEMPRRPKRRAANTSMTPTLWHRPDDGAGPRPPRVRR